MATAKDAKGNPIDRAGFRCWVRRLIEADRAEDETVARAKDIAAEHGADTSKMPLSLKRLAAYIGIPWAEWKALTQEQLDYEVDRWAAGQPKAKARKMKEPPLEAFKAYTLWRLGEMKQDRIAARMGNVPQWKVSRWCKAVAKWYGAVNPTPAAIGRPKTITADPAAIDIGERQDGRTIRQRARASDEE